MSEAATITLSRYAARSLPPELRQHSEFGYAIFDTFTQTWVSFATGFASRATAEAVARRYNDAYDKVHASSSQV